MVGATVEITGESNVGDVVARDLARAKASLDELEKSGGSAGPASGGLGAMLSGLLSGLPTSAEQIVAAIKAALDQLVALPPIQIRLSDDDAMSKINTVFAGATALASTSFDPVKITADNSDVFAKAKAVETRLAQIPDKTVTITVNVVTNGSVPDAAGGSAGAQAPAHAAGTLAAPGGLSLVGESGPELVSLPRGAQVWDALASRQMLSAGARGGDTYISALYITAPDNASLADLLRQAQSARGA